MRPWVPLRWKHYIPERYEILSEEIVCKTGKKLSNKYQMRTIGTTFELMERVNLLCLSFQIQGPLSREQLRVIVVGCVEEFLATVNANKEIRPYLCVYPFPAECIEVSIFVVDAKGRELYDPDIGVASEINGAVEYLITDNLNRYKYKSISSESYDEALNIVYGSKKADLSAAFTRSN
jgi:hypothetical protein